MSVAPDSDCLNGGLDPSCRGPFLRGCPFRCPALPLQGRPDYQVRASVGSTAGIARAATLIPITGCTIIASTCGGLDAVSKTTVLKV